MTPMSRALIRTTLLLLLSLASLAAGAQTRAWLDRDRIALGETVTLNIETDAGAAPDYDPLRAPFQISGHRSSRRVALSTGERSEKRRVGNEWVRTCRTRGSPYH